MEWIDLLSSPDYILCLEVSLSFPPLQLGVLIIIEIRCVKLQRNKGIAKAVSDDFVVKNINMTYQAVNPLNAVYWQVMASGT